MPQTNFSCQTCDSTDSCAEAGSPLTPGLDLTFAHLRQALVAALPVQVTDGSTPLSGWHPNTDLGSLVLESWAYVGDVLRFYSGTITNESYIQVAEQRRSRRRIAALLGYQPRPAVSARTDIAAVVDADSVKLNKTAYRASPPPGSTPQWFESNADTSARRRFSEYSIGPVRSNDASEGEERVYLIDAATAAAVRGRPVAFIWLDKVIKTHATEIVDVDTVRQSDGRDYVAMRVADAVVFYGNTVQRESVSLQSPSQRAYACTAAFDLPDEHPLVTVPDELDIDTNKSFVNVLPGGYNGTKAQEIDTAAFADKSQTIIWLDGVYRGINAGDMIILQAGGEFRVHRVVMTNELLAELADVDPPAPKLPLTRLTVNPGVAEDFVDFALPTNLVIHYNLHDIGRMTRVAHTELTAALLLDTALELEGIHDPPVDPPTRFILEDANGRGVLVDATFAVKTNGTATLTISGPAWDGGLRVPVKVYGNVIEITRGETVQDEILGDGDPTQPYQTFKLARSPLTYLSQVGAPNGIVSTLEIRVGGVRWHERPSFYGAGPNDAVYIVRHDDDQNTFITFGDGVRGMRLPAGVRNVRASYRHGAGAEVPPPGAINQIVKGTPGLMRVRSPIPAGGGADAETSREIQRRAPGSALVLGRCVSLADFSARVASIPGVRNSKVEFAWDDLAQTASVKVWYIPNTAGKDLGPDIVADLQAMSEPNTVIRAAMAVPMPDGIALDVLVDPDRNPDDIAAAVHAALLDPERGLLAPENTPIGGPISRSALLAVARSIPGVLDVTSIRYGLELPFPTPGLALAPGEYLDFSGAEAGDLVVTAVHAERLGCRDFVA